MIALILFCVFMALWFASTIPAPGNPSAPYGGIFAWLSVVCLAFAAHVIHFT